MGLLDRLKKNDDNQIPKIYDRKTNEVILFNKMAIQPEIIELLWFADGKYKNYNPEKNVYSVRYGPYTIEFNLPSTVEPSLIYSKLPINYRSKLSPMETIGYFPRYEGLSPDQRFLYLKWLTDITQQVDIGYVFLFYYGLERYLLREKYQKAAKMILKLRQFHKNQSFYYYSLDSLLSASILHKDELLLNSILSSLDESLPKSNVMLIAKKMLKVDLTITEIISLSSTIGFKKRTYIRDYPDIFSKNLKSILISEFGKDTFPFHELDGNYTYKEERVFANTALTSQIKPPMLPSIIDNKDFITSLFNLLETAHETTKKEITELRKSDDFVDVRKTRITQPREKKEYKVNKTLENQYLSTNTYEPEFCELADSYYKVEDYDLCIDTCKELAKRAKRDRTIWMGQVPPAVYGIMAKAQRAAGNRAKKEGDMKMALVYFSQLMMSDYVTENDKRIYDKLIKL